MQFEYPTQAKFEQMPNDTRLESITFDSLKSSEKYFGDGLNYGLCSVQVNLSHGFSSPLEMNSFPSRAIYSRTIDFPDQATCQRGGSIKIISCVGKRDKMIRPGPG